MAKVLIEAFGLARVAIELMVRQGKRDVDADIVDQGQYFEITCIPGIDETNLELLRENHIFPIKPIPTEYYNKDKQPVGVPLEDWDAIREYLSSAKSGNRIAVAVPDNLDVLLTINPEAIQGYDGLLFRIWNARHVQPEIFAILLNLYTKSPKNIDKATISWKKIAKKHEQLISEDKGWKISPLISGQQIYNPVQGMGHLATKLTDTLSIKKHKINFWLVEWIRAIGFDAISLPQLVGDRDKKSMDKDRKILILHPKSLSYSISSNVMKKFKNIMLPETAVRFDLMAVIRYLKSLLIYYVELFEEDEDFEMEKLGRVTETLVSGFHVAFYKKMGQGRSLMNLSFIAFPTWVEVNSEDDVRFYLGLLEELEKFINQFREDDKQDKGYNVSDLLQHLRDFLSGDDLAAFFRFTNAFAGFYMGKRERNQYARQLTVDLIERIVMSIDKPLGRILENEGFQNIAYAIRQATVTAQYRKKQKDNKYEVRYGLGQDLARKARYPNDFIVALSDFLHKYNAENARVMEIRPKPYRRSIQTSDIDQIVSLIDDYGSETVANLLIAYGHARIPRDDVFTEESNSKENE